MDLCERIKSERIRLGYSQEEFGAFGGVKRNAQAKYERGETVPDANYLVKVGEAGADIIFIMTGAPSLPSSVIYGSVEEALNAVIEVQGELELLFTADQLKNLLGLAWKSQLNHDQLKAAVTNSYSFHGVEMHPKKDA